MLNRAKTGRLTVSIPADLMRRVEKIAAAMEMTSADIVELAVDRLVRAPDPQLAVTQIQRESRDSAPRDDRVK
jgi:predicted transcriptional regulator